MSTPEVVVVGAGPSGAVTALLLARAGHAVAVFDRAAFPRDKACGEGLMPPGVAVLRRLGLLDAVLASGARAIDGVEYTERHGRWTARATFPMPPSGGEPWALGVRRTEFDNVLVDVLRDHPRVELHEHEPVNALLRARDGAIAGVATDRGNHRARTVVAADGLHSRLRSLAGLLMPATRRRRYGLAGHWHVDVSERRHITVKFADGHEWYTAPVSADTLLVSVLAGRRPFGTIVRRYRDAACEALPVLRDAELTGAPLAAGLFHQRARTVASPGIFLVGDAAGYDDPTTGEGLAIGMETAEKAARWIHALLRGETDMQTACRRYAADHRALATERRRVTRLALLMARSEWLSTRAIRHAANDATALSKLCAINCGYAGFSSLTLRDWLALAGV